MPPTKTFTSPQSLVPSPQYLVHAGADIAQIGLVATGQLGVEIAVVADLRERPTHLRPVHIPLQQRHELIGGTLEVFEMHLPDAPAQRANPVLRPAENDHISHVEIDLYQRVPERIDVVGKLQRAEQEVVPDLLDADHYAQLLGGWD